MLAVGAVLRMMAILHNKVAVTKALNVNVLPLDDAPRGL